MLLPLLVAPAAAKCLWGMGGVGNVQVTKVVFPPSPCIFQTPNPHPAKMFSVGQKGICKNIYELESFFGETACFKLRNEIVPKPWTLVSVQIINHLLTICTGSHLRNNGTIGSLKKVLRAKIWGQFTRGSPLWVNVVSLCFCSCTG